MCRCSAPELAPGKRAAEDSVEGNGKRGRR